MRHVFWFALFGLCACRSTPHDPPMAPSPPPSGSMSDTDPTSSPDSAQVPTNPSGPTLVDGVYITYMIDGHSVGQAEFEALFARLEVDAKPFTGETVENQDGSYGGAGESFHARDGRIEYRYENHVYPLQDGSPGESRLLFRETP